MTASQSTTTDYNILPEETSQGSVCVICATFPPDICGVGDNAAHLSRTLRNLGWQVTVITSPAKLGPMPVPDGTGINIVRDHDRWSLGAILDVFRIIRSSQFDIVHIQYTPQVFGPLSFGIVVLPFFVRLFARRPVFVTFHEVFTPFIDNFKQNLLILINRLKDTLILLGASEAFVSVPARASRLGRLFPWKRGRFHVIPIGPNIVPETAADDDDGTGPDRDLRKRFGIDEGTTILGSFGMLHIDKRYDLLLKSVKGLIDRGRKVQLVLIGPYSDDHPYYSYMKKCIDELGLHPYINWTGTGTPAEVSKWFSSLDIYVMTDVRGASGRKSSMLSALSHGLPVVSNHGPDTTDNFENDRNIVLLAEDDESGFVTAIESLIRDNDYRRKIGLEARRLYERSYAWDIIAGQTIELYRSYAP